MSENNQKDFLDWVKILRKELEIVEAKVDLLNQDINSPDLIDKVGEMYDTIVRLIKIQTESDKNLTLDHNLGSVDEYFEGNPYNDYINKSIEYLQGKASVEEVVKAAKQIEPLTVEDFVSNIVKSLSFNEEEEKEYKPKFEKELTEAVNRFRDKSGFAHFYVTVDGDFKEGSIHKESGSSKVFVNINDLEYVYNFDNENSVDEDIEIESEECTHVPETCSNPNCCIYTSIGEPPTSTLVEKDEQVNSLHTYIQEIDEEYYTQISVVLDDIVELLKDKTTLSPNDKDLMRFYLTHIPYPYADVDRMSTEELNRTFQDEVRRK